MTNPTHRNETTAAIPTDDLTVSWQIELGDTIRTLTAGGEQIYAGTSNGLVAVEDDGTERWRIDGKASWAAPALCDEVVYVPIWKKNPGLHAVDTQTGETMWHYSTENPRSPCVVGDTVYGAGKDSVFALDRTSGEQIWLCVVSGSVDLAVADGRVFSGSAELEMYAIDAGSGERLWTANIDSMPAEGGATVVDGILYFTGHAGLGPERQIYAVSAETGALEWVVDNIGSDSGAPAVVHGVVYTADWGLSALNAGSGEVLWQYEGETLFSPSPLIVDSTVFVGGRDAQIHAVNATDGTGRWTIETAGEVKAAPVTADGTLYVAGGSHLYALSADE
ncbi:PQQ-binding-like beta-propeller repeat protein [Haloarcula rubripromontorii]|uniref:outer membrane protein assembly factor BamB family protein n=1 Tax=Haloarcula rubripromontorii TaxID=1705562 RepID=UPI00345BEF9E